jgi:inner membrane protein
MPTIITHGFLAAALGKSFASGRMPVRFWVLSVACSILPDADVIAFRLGIPYEDMLGHRGFSHSLAFALVLSLLVVFTAFERSPQGWTKPLLIVYFFVVTASHGVLDAMTDGGLGIAFFAPFDDTRYFFPFQPIRVSPIGRNFFSARGLDVVLSELVWVWLPVTVFAGATILFRRLRQRRSHLANE